jgi:hypothetical protein
MHPELIILAGDLLANTYVAADITNNESKLFMLSIFI